MKETILFLCAHNDDHIIGGGGTFAKYAREGKTVKTVIFSYGEMSHPHLKPGVIVETRVKEAKRSDRILKGKGLIFIGLREGRFLREFERVKEQLIDIIHKEHPGKIFTHSIDDPHPDHQAVHKMVVQLIKEKHIRCDVYTFEVWNPFTVRKRNVPKLVVDVTETFPLKLKAYDAHESQVNLPLMIPMRFRMHLNAMLAGWANHCRYAEVFHKLA
ncbi:MAG TPA: PIG-L deacetylase family protein [Candidatus Binatia bacterium]|nr:PIG-L deacetylase family protein [Candidatus Binatia bacterium]